MFFSLHRFRLSFFPRRPERNPLSAGKSPQTFRFEELEARRLLSAAPFFASSPADLQNAAAYESAEIASGAAVESALLAINTASNTASNAITNALTLYAEHTFNETTNTYTLSITASVNPTYLTTPIMYLNVFFSSVGLDKVSQDQLEAANSACNLVVSTQVPQTLLVPSFQIANLSRFSASNYSVTLGQDTGTNTGGSGLPTTDNTDSTQWYLQFFWNNAFGNLWTSQPSTFKLADLLLPVSADAAGFAGTLDFNFALRDSQSSWTVCYQDSETPLADTPAPHYQIQLPGSQRLDAPGNLKFTADSVQWNSFDVVWDPVEGASGYVVGWKKSDSTDDYIESEMLTDTTFSLTGLLGGTKYQAAVRAVTETDAGNSSWSKAVSKTTLQDTPYDITPLAVTINEMAEIDTLVTKLSANDPNPAHTASIRFTLSTQQLNQVDSEYFQIEGNNQNSVCLKKRAAAGIYELWVTACDASGFKSEASKLVITVAKAPKAIVNTMSLSVLSGCCFFVSGSESTPSNGQTITNYYWDLNGDGKADRLSKEFYASIAELGAPKANGTRTIQFWVSDSAGWKSAKTQIDVTVVDRAETINYISTSLFDGKYLKLETERFDLNGAAVSSWKILWDATGEPNEADWDNAESFDTTANTLRAVHYYAPQADDAVYSVRLRLVTSDAATDFLLGNHLVAGIGLNSWLAETPTDDEIAPKETIQPTTDAAALAAPIQTLAAKARLDLALETTSPQNGSDALWEETSALEPLDAEPLGALLPAAEWTAALWENRLDGPTLYDFAFTDGADEEESARDAELNETLETVFSARQLLLPDD